MPIARSIRTDIAALTVVTACPLSARILVFDEIVNPAHVAADGARRKKIKEHADQIVAQHGCKRRLDAKRPGQSRPARRADALG